MKFDLAASFIISVAFGAAIWVMSPLVTGHVEPWDSDSYYYIGTIVTFGLVVGAFFPKRVWPAFIGLVSGQFGYLLIFLPKGPLIGVGLVSLLIYALLMAAAGSISSRLRRMWQAHEMARGNGA